MKFNCGLSAEEKWEYKKKWHPWFAWYPVRIGHRDCRWLEYVDRKYVFHCFDMGAFGEYKYAPLSEGKD